MRLDSASVGLQQWLDRQPVTSLRLHVTGHTLADTEAWRYGAVFATAGIRQDASVGRCPALDGLKQNKNTKAPGHISLSGCPYVPLAWGQCFAFLRVKRQADMDNL